MKALVERLSGISRGTSVFTVRKRLAYFRCWTSSPPIHWEKCHNIERVMLPRCDAAVFSPVAQAV
jgi:hypothetical protein